MTLLKKSTPVARIEKIKKELSKDGPDVSYPPPPPKKNGLSFLLKFRIYLLALCQTMAGGLIIGNAFKNRMYNGILQSYVKNVVKNLVHMFKNNLTFSTSIKNLKIICRNSASWSCTDAAHCIHYTVVIFSLSFNLILKRIKIYANTRLIN